LKRADFSVGNKINNLIIILILSTSGFKKKTKWGKGTNTHMHRREDLQKEHKQQLVLLVFDFQFI